MPKNCPQCGDPMLPADDMNCSKARWVCTGCAPDFVLANATTFDDTEDPLLAPDER